MENSTFRMVKVSSYGSKIYETIILENAPLSSIKKKYFEMAGNYLGVIFERNFNDNSKHFTLPYSYDTIHVYQN
jgi:hypothetical protein